MNGASDRTPEGGYKIRTYYPTLEQMKNFSAYMKHIHEDGGHRAGLVKIVPPKDYAPRKESYEEDDVYNMEITCPIKQQVTGEGGLYQQLNIVEKKKMLVRNFKKLAETKYPTPIHDEQQPEDLERKFWKTIFTNPAIYGADVPGTLYDDSCNEFNLTKLDTILDNIQNDYGVTIQGVNTTYLYFGMWKSSFCWHTEDIDLYSINYLHTGEPKSWYCIAPEYGKRFERLAASFFPHSFRTCRAFLRHKTTMISPQILKKYSIPFSKCTQKKGEFMVTFPYSYHSGYNHGFNIAEATNFALEYWIDFGKWATRCECSSESVKISMQTFVKRYQADRYENWLKGRDICKDPRDPKHVAAAPKPTEYDLYLIGSHEREIAAAADTQQFAVEDTKQKTALQQNQSSNVKLKIKKVKKKTNSNENSYNLFNEYRLGLQDDRNAESPQYASYCPIPESLEEKPRDLSIKKLSDQTMYNMIERRRPDNNQIVKRNLKRLKEKEDKKRLRREKRAQERKVASQGLLQFMPSTFTHEKRFNRCIASQPPHCAVCQLLVKHPKDDENIWGCKDNPDESRRSSVEDQSPAPSNDNDKVDMIDSTTPPIEPSTTPTPPTAPTPPPVSTVSGPRVENFKLPEASPVLLPRNLFMRNPEETLQNGDFLEFLDLNLESCELLQCVICMLTVHRLCYGVDKMPDNKSEWTCDRCKESNRSLIGCSLCPCRGGALKSVSNIWVHVTCVLSVPGLKFIDLIKPNESAIQKPGLPPIANEKNICIYCSRNFNLAKSAQGRCISCIGHFAPDGKEVPCANTFHTTCGHRNGASFIDVDCHHDPQSPIMASCTDCSGTYQVVDSESYEELDRTRSHDPIPVGAAVIARTKEGKLIKGAIREHIVCYHYDVFFPKTSEVELGIKPSRIQNHDDNREYQIGDPVKVRCFNEKTRVGKFKARHLIEEYSVSFLNGQMPEKIARADIYLNVDEMTPEQNEKYLKDSEAGECDIDMEQQS